MPELKQLRVVVGGRMAQGVMRGDLMTLKGDDRVVETTVEKQSYEYYTFTDGTKGRLPLDSEVNVQRNVPTPEEDAADNLARFARKMREYHDHAFKSLDKSMEVLTGSYRAARDKGNYRPFDLDKAASIAKDQEEAGVWASVADNVMKHEELAPDVRWLRAVLAMRQYAREALTSRYRNSLSRSTSVISNLTEDLRMDAWSQFLQDTDYHPYNEMAAVYLPSFEIKEV